MKAFHIDVHVYATAFGNPYNIKASTRVDVDDDTRLDEIMDIPLGKLILGSAYAPKEDDEDHSYHRDWPGIARALHALFAASDVINEQANRCINQPEAFKAGFILDYTTPYPNADETMWMSRNRISCVNDPSSAFDIIITAHCDGFCVLTKPITISYIGNNGLEVHLIEIMPLTRTIKFPLYPTLWSKTLMTTDRWCELAYELEKRLGYKLSVGDEFAFIADKIEKLRKADTKEQEE